MTARLLGEVGSLLQAARRAARGSVAEQLEAASQRLGEPLRVAIAGRLKAGKSTLVNALVGEKVAATDATECTRIITWYENGPTYAALRRAADGLERNVKFERDGITTRIIMDGEEPFADDEHLHLRMPSPTLRAMTLVDTPGIDTTSDELSRRSAAFFGAPTEVSPVDAVVYVVQHTHPEDVAFLEAFHGDLASGSPMNAIGVLSRADEVGGGDLDAMEVAATIARRHATDPVVRRLVQSVEPVSGLTGTGGATLRERHFSALKELASWPDRERALLGVQTLLSAVEHSPSPATRLELVDELGIFGVRVAVDLIVSGEAVTSPQLSDVLLEVSGIRSLRRVLSSRLGERGDLLKARSALAAVANAIEALPESEASAVARQLEAVVAGAHELAELAALDELRQSPGILGEEDTARLERLLGGTGANPAQRVGLDGAASAADMEEAVRTELSHWRRIGELGLVPGSRHLADVAIRTCEGVLG